MSNIQELIKAKQKEMADKKAGSIRTVKPVAGKQMYRILPGWDAKNRGQFWQDFGMHWIKTELNGKPVAVHLCEEKTHGEACDICGAIGQAIGHSKSDNQLELLKGCNSSQRYIVNALHLNGEDPNAVIVLEVGITVFEGISEIIGEHGDITDLDKGINLIIKREGTGFDTTYHVVNSAKKTTVPKATLERLVDLEALVNGQRNDTKMKASLENIAKIVGLEAATGTQTALPPSKKSKAASAAAELDDDSLFEDDIPFNEGDSPKKEETVTKEEEDGIDDDMLEDLMSS
jgi:hypothetical protein